MPINIPLPLIFSAAAVLFGWQAIRGLTRGSTNLPVSLLELEEFDRESIYFWGIIGMNGLLAIAFAVLGLLAYLNNWGAMPWLQEGRE
jgi:hypothetical protein